MDVILLNKVTVVSMESLKLDYFTTVRIVHRNPRRFFLAHGLRILVCKFKRVPAKINSIFGV